MKITIYTTGYTDINQSVYTFHEVEVKFARTGVEVGKPVRNDPQRRWLGSVFFPWNQVARVEVDEHPEPEQLQPLASVSTLNAEGKESTEDESSSTVVRGRFS